MPFERLNLVEPLRRAVASEGYEKPTPIQEQAIPHVLAGRDLLGCAQTGTGKTAAFTLPLLQRLSERGHRGPIRALVLSPTRELASQIGERMTAYGRHVGVRHTVIFGGVSQARQERALRSRPDVVVATPGRLLDLCSQKLVDLSRVEILVLDEADRMLDMGFIHDVRRIVRMTPTERQTLFFSATLQGDIARLAKSILKDPVRVDVAPAKKTADTVEQSVFFVSKRDKRPLLEDVLRDPAVERALVFTRTKHAASRIADQLSRARIPAGAIHGNKTQNARERALADFRRGTTRVLVATDIAARGIDVLGVSHVVNFDLPATPESYVHRIGRTGRAGATGLAMSFCDDAERPLLKSIERLIGKRLPVGASAPDAPRKEAPGPRAHASAARTEQRRPSPPTTKAREATGVAARATEGPATGPGKSKGRRRNRRRRARSHAGPAC